MVSWGAVRALAEQRGLQGLGYCDIDTFDLSSPGAYEGIGRGPYGTVINCGAFTAVDKVETAEGHVVRWKANATGPVPMAQVCALQGIALVHVAPIACSSWVIGDSHDLAKKMMGLSNRVAAGGIPQVTVVDDQACHLSFTRDMAEGIFWLLGYREGDMEPSKPVPYGAYNLTGSGQPKG